MGRWQAALRAVVTIAAVASVWVAAFSANEWLFASEQHSQRANWIFLPAAVRLLAVLLFEEIGAIGLAVGAFAILSAGRAEDWAYNLGLAALSGAAPLLALLACRKVIGISADLAGLRPRHIVLLSLSGALANALLLNGYLVAIGRYDADFAQLMAVFVGDSVGIAIVLTALSSLLVLVMPRRSGV